MELFIDTNIVIDLLAAREGFVENARKIFSRADEKKYKLYISSLTFANSYYILSKELGKSNAKKVLRKFKILVTILPVTDKIINRALDDEGFRDFEDALQYFCALDHHIQLIITRDLKHFKHVKTPIFSPQSFLAK